MAHLDHEPFFSMEKSHTADDVERIYKVKYEKVTQDGRKIKSEVTPDSGEHGIEFLLAEKNTSS